MTYKTPCQRKPEAWDLNPEEREMWVTQANAAVQACEGCPGLRTCGLLALDQPPQHDCVVGAWVSYQGRLMRFEQFAVRMAIPTVPAVTCALGGCNTQFYPRSKEHRYCCKEHRDRTKNTPAGAVATIPEPKTCALDGCQVSFIPKGGRHWFCSKSCKMASRRRREAARRDAIEKRRQRDEAAVKLVEDGQSMRSVATQFGVPYMTVYRAVNGARAAAAVAA